MKDKKITLNSKAKEGLINGVKKLNDAVSSTLGPNGSTVVIEAPGRTIVTKDGVTVASYIQLKDHVENLGVSMVKQVSEQAAKLAGDGTTTATILATSIIEEGYKAITVGANANGVKRGLEIARQVYLEYLASDYKRELQSETDILNVATISANNDSEMGKLIADALTEVGVNGAINVENSPTSETTVNMIEGYQLENRGFCSPYFVTHEGKNTCEYKKPLILMTEATISSNAQIMAALNIAKSADRPILVIADKVEGEALATMVTNKLRQTLNSVAIHAPLHGQFRSKVFGDLAAITGGIVFNTPENNRSVDTVKLEDLGTCDKIVVSDNNTIIIGGCGNHEAIENRISLIEEELPDIKNDMHRDFANDRISKLAGGICQIFIGAHTEVELKEKKDRLEDSLHATRAALEEGIVMGGGVTNLRLQRQLKKFFSENSDKYTVDQNAGIQAFINALDKPFLKLLENTSGLSIPEIYYDVTKNENVTEGYNVLTGEYGDMFEMGVVDPAKVTRVAIETAVSISGAILTTNCVISYDDHETGKPDIVL